MNAQALHPNVAAPEFLQLAGHPLRWRLLNELARSDRAVRELTELAGESQNLVSYHLGKLRDGQLVSARHSSADRRDTYYGLNLPTFRDLLSGVGATLHPGLRLAPTTYDPSLIRGARVLFLCTGNSARSQMAEALVKSLSGGAIKAYSAGSHPKPLHPNAVQVMRKEFGLDLNGYKSKHLDVFANKRFDWVVSLCDRVREVCPEFAGHPETVHWSMANPVTGDADRATYPLFERTAAELKTRIEFFLPMLAEQSKKRDA